MKSIIYLLVMFMMITSCNSQKSAIESVGKSNTKYSEVDKLSIDTNKKMELPIIVYESLSRGFYKKITISNNRIYIKSAQEAKPIFWELKPDDVKKLEVAYSEIDVTKLPELKAPTEKRFYDGAPITTLSVTKGSEVYTTTGFDGGFPPNYIEKLVNTILAVADYSLVKNPIIGSYSVEELVTKDVSKKEYFISFDTEGVSGFMGCNMYSGSYKIKENTLTFSPLVATRKYCVNEMDNEDLWLNKVSEVSSFTIENKTIFLLDRENKVILKATKK